MRSAVLVRRNGLLEGDVSRGAQPPAAGADAVTIELCVDETGRVTSARAGEATPAAQLAVDKAWTWRFAPYFVRGKPMAVCSYVRFGDDHERDDDTAD